MASFNHLTICHPNDCIMMLDYGMTSCSIALFSMITGIQSSNTKTYTNHFHAIGQDYFLQHIQYY